MLCDSRSWAICALVWSSTAQEVKCRKSQTMRSHQVPKPLLSVYSTLAHQDNLLLRRSRRFFIDKWDQISNFASLLKSYIADI